MPTLIAGILVLEFKAREENWSDGEQLLHHQYKKFRVKRNEKPAGEAGISELSAKGD